MVNQPERQYYIDWVRVLAFFILIFFHCAMPFVSFSWEIKNPSSSIMLSRLIWWLHQWRLPLLFFISGVGTHYSLRRRSVAAFAGERFLRLFVPLLFAMFFTIPLQVYYERLQKGQITGSYLDFYPTVWNLVPYPEGTLTWSHMWFVVYLFVYCILLLPVFALFKIKALNRVKEKISSLLSNPFLAVLLCLPFVYYYFTLYLKYPEQESLLDDWFLFISSITFFFYGFLLGGNIRFWEMCEKYRKYFLAIALFCMLLLFYAYWWNLAMPKKPGNGLTAYGILNSVHVWTLIMAILGFAKKHLNYSNPFLRYTNQAVYPFYILHQTIIVAFGYYVVQWSLPIFLKFFILILLCFLSVNILYRWIIKPFVLTRILYGLKPKEKRE
jgi:glucans biosynthesis protein C